MKPRDDTRSPSTSDLMQRVYAASVVRGRWFRSPRDTWTMALFHVDASRTLTVTALPTPTDDAKSEVAQAIERALTATLAAEALLVAPAWEALVSPDVAATADVSGAQAMGIGRDDFVPQRDRVEVLLFLHVGAGFARTRSAPVLRSPGEMPALGPLSPILGEGIEVDGLFTDAMRKGIG